MRDRALQVLADPESASAVASTTVMKMAQGLAQPDPETGLQVKPPSSSLTGKPKSYAKPNVVSTPPARGMDIGAKSVAPPRVG